MIKWDKIFDINVSLKVIRHISAGIYRTPGGAIKELVSNSFDAKANEVSITVAPDFHEITVEDDGDGMTEEIIERSLQYIGASIKVSEPEKFEGEIERPVIGQFGIGLLSSAHASKEIVVFTYPKDKDYGLEVLIDLSPYFEFENQIHTLEEFSFGSVKYKKIPRNGKKGTIVKLTKIEKDSNFYKTISRKPEKPKGRIITWPTKKEEGDNAEIMDFFVREIGERGVSSIEYLSGLEKLLWELGIICPVRYLPKGPFEGVNLDNETQTIVEGLIKKNEELGFKLFFNNVDVRKPILLPTPKLRESYIDNLDKVGITEDVRVFPIKIDHNETGKPTIFVRGYAIVQPHRIIPQEIRGLYPRVKFVGIGGYDSQLFKVLRSTRPMFQMTLSGELYIFSGLDDAINLDRSWFIELDEQYQIMRDEISRIVNEIILVRATEISARRSKRITRLKGEHQRKDFLKRIEITMKQVRPSFKVEFLDFAQLELEPSDIFYGRFIVNDEKRTVYIDEFEDDIDLVNVIMIVDSTLSSAPWGKELRLLIAQKISEILRDL